MYTQCPNCSTVYRITTEQLKIAGGKVKCSTCALVFNALNALGDHDTEEIDIPEQPQVKPVTEVSAVKKQPATQPRSKPAPPKRARVRKKSEDIPTDLLVNHNIDHRTLDDTPTASDAETAHSPPLTDSNLALELEDLIDTRTFTPMTFVWLLGSVLLLLTWFAQYGYYNRLTFAQQPDLRESVEMLCQLLDCEIPPLRDIEAITIQRRDVREQSNAPKTLLINLTIANKALFTQPYPNIQVSLFDDQPNLIGKRLFTPDEYLSKRDIIDRGMPPNTPTHLIFEIVAPARDASGFQFDFY